MPACSTVCRVFRAFPYCCPAGTTKRRSCASSSPSISGRLLPPTGHIAVRGACAVQALREREHRTVCTVSVPTHQHWLRRCGPLRCLHTAASRSHRSCVFAAESSPVRHSRCMRCRSCLRSRAALLHASIRCAAARCIGVIPHGLLDLILHTAVRRVVLRPEGGIRCRRAAAAHRAERGHQPPPRPAQTAAAATIVNTGRRRIIGFAARPPERFPPAADVP